MMTDTIRILIADDHPLIRLALRLELEAADYEVCAEAADRDGAVASALRLEPDVCILDVQMPGGGIAAAREITRLLPGTRVLMLTSSEDETDMVAAIRAGAAGWLGKDSDPARLPHVLAALLRGEVAVPRGFVSVLVGQLARPHESACRGAALSG